MGELFGGSARVLTAHASGPRSLRPRGRPSLRPRGQSLSRTRRQGLAGQCASASPRWLEGGGRLGLGRRRLLPARPRACPRLAGRPRARLSPFRRRAEVGASRCTTSPSRGAFRRRSFATLGLPPQAFVIGGVEYFGGVGYLKAGLQFADAITTVSPTYAREILTPEYGMGLDGLLRQRRGVLPASSTASIRTCGTRPSTRCRRRALPAPGPAGAAAGQQTGGRGALRAR